MMCINTKYSAAAFCEKRCDAQQGANVFFFKSTTLRKSTPVILNSKVTLHALVATIFHNIPEYITILGYNMQKTRAEKADPLDDKVKVKDSRALIISHNISCGIVSISYPWLALQHCEHDLQDSISFNLATIWKEEN